MKNILFASLIAATSGLVAAPQASAKNEGLAAVGGFIGGVIVGSALQHANDRPDYRPDYRGNHYAPVAPPVCAPAPVCEPAPVRYLPSAPRGYWKEVQVRTWVPERWTVRHDRRGFPVRYCEPGYYTMGTQRVWVGRG